MTAVEPDLLRPAATYERHLAEGRLTYQRCGGCGGAVFYPRVVCPNCGSARLVWRTSSGRGTVYSTTAVPQRGAPSYSVCLIDLDDGFRMMSTVVDAVAEDVPIGGRVVADVQHHDDGHRVVFRIEDGADGA